MGHFDFSRFVLSGELYSYMLLSSTPTMEIIMLLTPERLRFLLADTNYSKVARATGLSQATVGRMATGEMNNPTADTLQKLTHYFEAKTNGPTQESN